MASFIFEGLKTPLVFPPTLTPTISLDIIRLARVPNYMKNVSVTMIMQ